LNFVALKIFGVIKMAIDLFALWDSVRFLRALVSEKRAVFALRA
jgi:hypothetical protein